jgi:hypothetical protein
MKLNDYNELEFKTDELGFPSNICGDHDKNVNKERFLIEIQPKFIAYQITKIKDMVINIAIEIVESKYNTDNKPIGILTDKNLYLVLSMVIVALIIFLCLCRNKLKTLLINYVMLNTSQSHHHHTH